MSSLSFRLVRERAGALLRRARPAWLCLLGFLLAFLLAWGIAYLSGAHTISARIRYAGTVLRFGGLGLVAWDLRKRRQQFGQSTVVKDLIQWMKDALAIFKRPRDYVLGAGAATLGAMSLEGKASVGSTATATLEAQIDELRRSSRSTARMPQLDSAWSTNSLQQPGKT